MPSVEDLWATRQLDASRIPFVNEKRFCIGFALVLVPFAMASPRIPVELQWWKPNCAY